LNILLLLLLLCFQASCHPLDQHQEHKKCLFMQNVLVFRG
jgi:hypothetical protein